MNFYGRKKITTPVTKITRANILDVLQSAFTTHVLNRSDINYLYDYYKGKQPILNREKEVRPEIMNMVVENRANEIVSFKVGYLMGEPVQYISRGEDAETESINQLNSYMIAEDKAPKDKELSEWSHICGTAYRMVLPDSAVEVAEDEAPFEIYTLDPRQTFVVYNSGLGEKPLMGVTYSKNIDGLDVFSCYTADTYFEVLDLIKITAEYPQPLGIPIIEYPLNSSRLGAFEIVLPLLDAINNVVSNQLDGIEQFIQALMIFHNVDIDEGDFAALRSEGALKIRDVDPQFKGEVKYLVEQLNQNQTETVVDHCYEAILTICGMPNRNGGSSTSDTGTAVVFRDGWSSAEARAKDSELMFKKSEREFLQKVLRICADTSSLDLKMSAIEIHFTRRNYENITSKANVLVQMLNNDKIAPQLAFEHCGLFIDPDSAYKLSEAYAQQRKAEQLAEMERLAGIRHDDEYEEDV